MIVNKMTDQLLNQALAQLTDYENLENYDEPCYSYEPAASMEIQEKAIKINPELYVRSLGEIVSGWAAEKYKWSTVANLLTATPRQRAEAAYITLIESKNSHT
ncbi:hypothetical protein [Paenibacillus amylolyticus]|uniref:hypothetical protein n=1 Tax=Paenibacillus amylolyticus TaxID=1451 RepID=UPI0033996A11